MIPDSQPTASSQQNWKKHVFEEDVEQCSRKGRKLVEDTRVEVGEREREGEIDGNRETEGDEKNGIGTGAGRLKTPCRALPG